jgi:putative transcriptional regulator
MDNMNYTWKKPTDKPAAGKLLIAEPFLGDPNFSRTVILLCEHGPDGSLGFVLNQITNYTLPDLLPGLYAPALVIHKGGPVQVDTLHVLHRMPEALGGTEVAPNIFWGGSYESLQDVIANHAYNPADLRLFVGYSGWGVGQLEHEFAQHSWLVTDTTSDLVFDTSETDVWKKAVALLGERYSFLANLPIDPQYN